MADRTTNGARRGRLATSVLGPVLGLVLLLSACGGGAGAESFTGRVLEEPLQVSDTPLVDTDGDSFSLTEDTDAPMTLVFFGYTNCADICPMVLNNLASAMVRLDEADRERVEVVFVTSDPAVDTGPVIREYLDRTDPDFIGLRADFDTVEEVGRTLNVGLDEQDPGGHTTQVWAIDGADEAAVYWSASTSPAQYANDIHTLLNG